MKTLKILFVAAFICMSTSTFANSIYGVDRNSVSKEIQKLLSDSSLIIEEELTVIVKFTLSEENEIQLYSVRSENEKINDYFKEKLEKQKLPTGKLVTKKLYEVPVRITSKR